MDTQETDETLGERAAASDQLWEELRVFGVLLKIHTTKNNCLICNVLFLVLKSPYT